MTHKPIQLNHVSLFFPHKICFEDFTTSIHSGDRIAIIGQNGSGKSTLLKILIGLIEPSDGEIKVPKGILYGYVPQIIEEFSSLSGGLRFQKSLSQALAEEPQILLLDEPTNHLDSDNRFSLMTLLRGYPGTTIIVSHDEELLRTYAHTIWHLEGEKVSVFKGSYENHISYQQKKRSLLEEKLQLLAREKNEVHLDLMKEQERSKKKRAHGEKKYDGDKLALRSAQGRGEKTSNKNKKGIHHEKNYILEELNHIKISSIIKPTFSISPGEISSKNIIFITDGSVAYHESNISPNTHSKKEPDFVLEQINFSIGAQERIALLGANGSGKSTLVKAILNDPSIFTLGKWSALRKEDIGYLDQHYSSLNPEKTVFESISSLVPSWSQAQIRYHLNNFLFRKNEEVNTLVALLSGGEKARLSLAQIAALTPKLLILDEITNNLDKESRNHVTEVLKLFPGALLIISHDHYFLDNIKINTKYMIQKRQIILV